MGLEDAAALETFFSAASFDPAIDSVAKRLEMWNSFRMPRDAVTQLISNAMVYNQPVDKALERVRHYYSGPLPPSSTHSGWDEVFQDFSYSYNVFAAAEKALRYRDADEIPEGVVEHFGLKASTGQTSIISSYQSPIPN